MRLMIVLPALLALIALFSVTADAAEGEKGKPTEVSVFDAGSLEVPAEFKRVAPRSRILEHEFEVKAGEGDDAQSARLTMMAAGGDIDANIQRWFGQFAGGKKEDQKKEEMKLGDWKVYLVDAAGTYAERMGGGPFAGGRVVNRPDYGMTAAILVHPDGRKYFLKMIGPQTVIQANREAFVEMVKSLEK